MDSLKKDLREYRGCFIALGVILLFGLFMVIAVNGEPYLGDYSPVAAFAALAIGVLMWIGLARGARWAKVVAGTLLLIVGAGATIFILYDFVTSLIEGQSLLRTPAVAAFAYGQSVFIFLMIGLALILGGLYLIGAWKPR